MKLVSYIHDGQRRTGALKGDEIVPFGLEIGDINAIIEGGQPALTAAQNAAANGAGRIPLSEVRLMPPLTRFRRDILCTGWNYWDHFEEGRGKREGQDVDRPSHPTFFTKSPDTAIGARDPIAFDAEISQKWDYEVELAIVIGKTGRSISEDRAMDHIFGYCLANDVSQRDLQRAHGGQWLKGKSIDGTMPLGPWLVTADAFDPFDVELECLVNGERRQHASTRQMAFAIPKLIAELSWGMTLHAGDVLLTGTPAGVGNAADPPFFLKAGDEIVSRGAGLGELRNIMTETDLHSPKRG